MTKPNNKYRIVDAHAHPGGLDEAIRYIHSKWGRPENEPFYRDAISHYGAQLPRFFLLMEEDRTIGCGALIVNDFVSRHDLWPWYACHFVESDVRGAGLGKMLLDHAVELCREMGFQCIHLSTSLTGYYEKYGWKRVEDAFEPSGERTIVYRYNL